MSEASLERRVENIIGLVLGKAVSPGERLAMASEPAWDSMKHIELVMTLEQELGISFEPEDIPRLTSSYVIIAKVKELHAS